MSSRCSGPRVGFSANVWGFGIPIQPLQGSCTFSSRLGSASTRQRLPGDTESDDRLLTPAEV